MLRKRSGARAYARLALAFYSDDDHFGPTERAVPGYTLFDLGGGFKLAVPIELRVLRAQPAQRGVLRQPGRPHRFAAGRSANVTLGVKF